MSQTRNESTDDRRQETEQEQSTGGDRQRDDAEGATQWFATTAVRIGLTLIGVVLLLFALGQAVGFPLLELATEALTSQTGRWLVVAFFAVLLIAAAQRAFSTP